MRPPILLAGPALLLAACGGGGQADNTINADESLSAENFSSNDITAIDAVTGEASNMAADVNHIAELDPLVDADDGDGDSGSGREPSAGKGSSARRSTSNAADSDTAAPEPAANSTATANNAI